MIPLRDNVPTSTRPVVTVALIAANVLVYFVYQRAGLQTSVDPVNQLAFHPCEVNRSCPVVGEDWPITAFTSMFMHADILHLGGNMLFLWIFGNNVEDAMGHVRYLAFFLLSGLAATALQTAVTLSIAGEAGGEVPNLGASGAISGVMGAYFLLLPTANILVAFIFIVIFFLREVPAWLFLGFYALFQLWQANFQLAEPPTEGGVAVFAHIGGFVFGLATVKLFQKRQPALPSWC